MKNQCVEPAKIGTRPHISVLNKTKGNALVASRVIVAQGFFGRLRGLMFRNELREGEGLLLEKTSSIHMCFMRFPIDVIFLDSDNRVVKVVSDLKPWTLFCGAKGAVCVLELKSGDAWGHAWGQVSFGDFLEFRRDGVDG